MIDLPDKTLAELESLAEELRVTIARDPQHSVAELRDVEWEIDKRQWRNVARPDSHKQAAKDDPGSL